MDKEASDGNNWICDDFEEDDDEDGDNGNDEIVTEKLKISWEEVKHPSESKDGHSHSNREKEETLPFDPSQDVVDRYKQDEKHKCEMKEKKGDGEGVEGSVPQCRSVIMPNAVDSAFHQISTSTNRRGTTVASSQSNKDKDSPSGSISCLAPGSLQQQSLSIKNSDNGIGVSVPQPGAQSSESSTTINLVRNKGVHINQVSGSFEPLKPIQEQSQLRLDSDLNKKLFVKTQKIEECEQALTRRGVLLLTGGPGEGKTTAGLHLLKLMSDHWRPLILTDPQDWNNLSGPTPENNRYVILIDDAFGRTNLVEDLKTRWEQKFPMMLPMIEAGTVCVIFSFRTNIYLQYEQQFRTFELFRRCKTVNLSTDNLSEKERLAMFDFHLKLYSKNACVSDDEKTKIIKCRDLVSFPLCCYLFSTTLREQHGCNFFHRSLKYLAEVITNIRQNDPEGFFVLLLAMFYDNLLPKTVLDVFAQSSEDQEIIAKLSQVCTARPSLGSLLNSAKSLCQTFLIFDTEKKCFSFMHNSIQDAVFLEFCKDHLSKGLEMCSLRTLLEYVTTDQRSCQDIAVIVSESDFDVLASRLVREILSPSASLIFTHQAFKDLSFVRYISLFMNADTRNELAVYNREIQSCGVHQYLTDTTAIFLMNKCLNQPTIQHTFDCQHVNVFSIDSIPACFVLNGADRFAIRLLKGMKHCEVLFSRHAIKTLACAFYMKNKELADELIVLGAKITFDCFKAVCVAPSINENLVECAAGVILEEDADCLLNLLTLSLEHGHFECIKQLVLCMARDSRIVQLEEFCRRLLIMCHNTKPSWIPVSLEQTKCVEILELLKNMGVNCFTDYCVLLAAGCNDIQILKYLVTCGGNVHCTNETGQSPLHLAALYGSGKTVMYLLEQDVENHARDNNGFTPLHRAVQSSTESCDKVVLLADENAQLMLNSGESIIDVAIKKGDIASVEYLCSQFSASQEDIGLVEYYCRQITFGDSQLVQPLYVAVKELAQILSKPDSAENTVKEKWTQNRYNIVRYLIEAGFSLSYVDDSVVHSLCVITERGKEDVSEAIIGSCDIYTLCKLLQGAVQLNHSLLLAKLNCFVTSSLKVNDVMSNVKDITSNPLSHLACEVRVTGCFEYLVQRDEEESKKDNHSRMILHKACECGDTALVEKLVQAGAKVNVIDRDEKTPLHYACAQNDAASVECLVQRGATVNVRDKFRKTPLHYACGHGDTAMVECLVQRGAKVNLEGSNVKSKLHISSVVRYIGGVWFSLRRHLVTEKNIDEETPMHYACGHGDSAIVECLVQRGAKVNVRDKFRKTPLHYACGHGDTAKVECLVQRGAEVNGRDNDGKTPLHYACGHGDTAKVECLVQRGAEVKVKDNDGKTPLHYACVREDTAMVECLVQRGAEMNVN